MRFVLVLRVLLLPVGATRSLTLTESGTIADSKSVALGALIAVIAATDFFPAKMLLACKG